MKCAKNMTQMNNLSKVIIIFIVSSLVIAASSCKQRESEPLSATNTSISQESANPSKSSAEKPDVLDAKTTKTTDASKTVIKSVDKTQEKLPKLLDLGADKCIPCKMMKPILEELKTEYTGKLDIEFIDVWENPKESEKYGINLIPTQIFYDPEGKEFQRHEGFISKEDILATFKQKGMKFD
jgi:thioredoxin 1